MNIDEALTDMRKQIKDQGETMVIPMARFHIRDGFYTIAELEDFIVQFRATKQAQDRALKKSMEPISTQEYRDRAERNYAEGARLNKLANTAPMDLTQANLEKVVNKIVASEEAADWGGFGLATIKMEGGIADPDDFEWECDCEKCQDRYTKWKAKFIAQQKELRK